MIQPLQNILTQENQDLKNESGNVYIYIFIQYNIILINE